MNLPLTGVRVIDLTGFYAGPMCSQLWAEMGAQVIKVESIQRVDLPRLAAYLDNEPGKEPWNRGGWFHAVNTGKYGITLDMNNPKGKEIFFSLVKLSDVVVENFSPRVIENWKIEYEDLKRIKRDVIMVSMSGFGHTGPKRYNTALAPVMESSGGLSLISANPMSGKPTITETAYGDWCLAMGGAAGMLIALHHRHRTGKGQYIDVAGNEVLLSFLGEAIMNYTMNSQIQRTYGNRHPFMVPHGVYRCKGEDEWIAIAIGSEEEWKFFCEAIDNPALLQDIRFSDSLSRWHNQDELDKLVETWTMQHNHIEAMEMLQQFGVPAGAVLNAKEVTFNSHLQERKYFDVIEDCSEGRRHPTGRRMPAKYSVSPLPTPKRPPRLGEDNEFVFKDLLGMTDDDIANLEREGVIGKVPKHMSHYFSRRGYPIDAIEQAKVGRFDNNYKEELEAFYKR